MVENYKKYRLTQFGSEFTLVRQIITHTVSFFP